MTDRDDDTLMLAYVYDELSAEEARAFEQRLAADAGLRAEVDGLLATREMLGEDARYGEASGADLPPAHLKEAILKAEVLARPTEIRQAHASGGASGGLLSRLSLWLVGGGVAVTAAAAVLLVAKDGSGPDMVMPAPVAVDSAIAPRTASEEAVPAGQRQAEAKAEVEAEAEADSAARPELKVADEGDIGAAGGAGVDLNAASKGSGGLLDEEPRQKAKAPSRRDALGAGDGEPFAEGSFADDSVRDDDKRAYRDAPKEETVAEPAADPPAAEAEAPLRLEQSPSAAPPPSATRSSSAPRSPAAGRGAPAPAPAIAGPPPLPDHLRKQLAKKRAERQRAPAKDDGAGAAMQKKHVEQLEMTLLTAERELQQGRAQDAFDLFQSVSQQDPRGALVGVVPYVGQMRALEALRRHREVLALLPLVRRPGIQATGVPEGLLTAARSAEATGRLELARELYRELLVVKDKREEAEKALARLDARPALRQKAATEAASAAEASSADEP